MTEAVTEIVADATANVGAAEGAQTAVESAAPADAGKAPEPVSGAKTAAAEPIAGGKDEPSGDVAPKWADDWRQQIAGEDKKALERLGRFATPADIFKSLREAEKKLSEGVKPLAKPGEKATEEEWANYRKAAGIPDSVDDYVKSIELSDKREIGTDDKPVIAAFAERAIKAGVAPKDMAPLVEEYYAMQEEMVAQQAEKDAEFKASSMQALREEFGGDFKANINSLRPYFETVNGALFDNLLGGRLADGTKIGDHPDVIKFFVAKALQENPAATVVPAGGNQMEAIDTEIKTIKAQMGDPSSAYWKDAAMQDRYRKLVAAQEKLSGR
jgi:hypothetical protein